MSKNARSRMWSRWLSRKPAAELPSRLGMETLEDRLAPATFTWDGGGANSLWGTAANWANDSGPAQLTYRVPTALTVNTVTPGQPGQNEIQTFLVPGEDGIVFLATNVTGMINGVTITPMVGGGGGIPSNVDLTTLQGMFNTAYGAGNTLLSVVTQPGGDRVFTVQFRGALSNTNIPLLSGVYTPTIDLVFPAGAQRPVNQNDLVTNTVINSVSVQGQGIVGVVDTPYSISEAADPPVNSIILGNGTPSSGTFTVNAGSANVTFALPITLATNGNQSIFVGTAGTSLALTGALSASAVNNLNKDGPGTLDLTTANPNLLGGVKVNNGILQIRNTLALGPAGGTETVVGSGAGLYLNNVVAAAGQATIGEQLRLNGGGFDTIKGALYLEAGGPTIWSGQVILDIGVVSPPQAGGPGVVIGAGLDLAGAPLSLNITGLITDTAAGMGLVKDGPGEVRLGRSGGNTYRGQTNVNNGTLTVTDSLSLGDSRQTNPGAFQNPTAGTVVNVSPGRNGQLRIEAPVGGPAVKVVGEYLVLNGGGNDGFGSLYNTRGHNTWAGSVILGSPVPDGVNVSIGVLDPLDTTSLTVSGVVQAPFITGTSLTKVQPGRLIFTNNNTYLGDTTVAAGALTIRDSQGLGPAGDGGGTTVNAGAAVELDVERAYSSALFPQFDDLSRDTWSDSITNDEQRLSIREPITINGRGIGAGALGTGTTAAQRTGGTGAIRSWTGTNTWAETISLASGEASIGVELDGTRGTYSGNTTSRTGHPLPDTSYFRDDYSLTIQDPSTTGVVGIEGVRDTDFVKLGRGHLILPQANPYLGRTLIEEGWVTIQNNRSLGDVNPRRDLGDTAQQPTVVKAGASLHITPTAPNVELTILEENIVLEGLGIGSLPLQEQHPFSYINQQGALINLGGNNTVIADIGLVSTGFGVLTGPNQERGAGIGVERAAFVESPVGSGTFVLLDSKLTMTGDLSDGITYQRSFNQSTPATQLNGPGRRVYDVGATRGRISVPYDFGTTVDRLQIYYPDDSLPANLIYDTGDVATTGPLGGAVLGRGLATVNFGSPTSTGTTVTVVVSQSAAVVGWQVGVATIGATTPRGVVTQFPSSFVKLGSETLELQGAGSQSGKKNEVREGTLIARNDTTFGRATVGTEITQQVYDVTETSVASGAALHLMGSVPQQAGGVAAGLHVQDERLTLNQYGVQIRIAGQPTARFQLTYGGQPTDILQVPSGYTGAPGTYAAYLQDQINTKLTNIRTDLTAGIPGVTPADGLATVRELTQGVFVVTFGSARLNKLDIGAFAGESLLVNPPLITSKAEVRISGSNATLVGLSDDNTWRGPVTLARDALSNTPGTRIEVRANSRLSLLGDVLEGVPATGLGSGPGSDLVKYEAGDLTLGGAASSYRGTTYLKEGIITAVSSRAFGAASTGPSDPVTGITPGGTKIFNGAQLQIQGSLTIAGEALAVEGDGSPTLPALDSTIRWLNVGPGATNNGAIPVVAPATAGAPTSGRVQSISTDLTDPRVIYVTTAGAGAWKTKDGGLTWIPLFDLGSDVSGNELPLPPDSTLGSVVAGGLPRSAMMFGGSIAVSPSNPQTVYYATGDSNGVFNGIPNTNANAVDNYAGSGVYRSVDGGKTWERLVANNGTNPIYGQAVTKLIVDPFFENRIYVSTGVVRAANAGAANLNNANLNATAGVWRWTGANVGNEGWTNLTGNYSPGRGTVGAAPFDAAGGGGPLSPGPDDHFHFRFPNGQAGGPEAATWSDIALVVRFDDPNPANVKYTLYAALGESAIAGTLPGTPSRLDQIVRTGVYFTEDPDKVGAGTPGTGVAWWHGKGTLYPIPLDAVPPPISNVDLRPAGVGTTEGFPLGATNVDRQTNGYIKLTAITTSTAGANNSVGAAPRMVGGRSAYPVITVYASVAKPEADPGGESGELLGIFRSVGNNGVLAGWGWTRFDDFTATPTALASALGEAVPFFRPALGRYNQTLQVADFDPRVLTDNNPNELILGGLDSLFRNTNAQTSTTWSQIATDAVGFRPADQFHALHYDVSGRLLTGSDGGLWRWDRRTFSNLNSNLSAVQFNSVDPHPTDFRQALGGASDTGTQVWNGYNSPDGLTGPSWRRVDDLSTTVSSPGSGANPTTGSVTGVVRYDPFNPQTMFAVRDGILRRSQNGGANWVSLDPLAGAGNGFTAGDSNAFPTQSSNGYDLFPLVMDPLTPNRLLIGGLTFTGTSVSRLMESTDGGDTWTNLNTFQLDGLLGQTFIPRVIAVAGYQGEFRNDSRFATVTEGLSNTPDPRTIYVSNGTRIGVTKNRGVSWVFATAPDANTVTDITVNPVNRDEVYVTTTGVNVLLATATLTQGVPTPATNEVQTFIIPNRLGTFSITGVTGRFSNTVSLATLQAAFNAAAAPYGGGAGAPNTVLTETVLPNGDRRITITYQNASAATNVPQVAGSFDPFSRIHRSLDAGQTWTDITGTFDPQPTNPNVGQLPDIPTWKVVVDPRSGTLYVGNDDGVWQLVDANATDPANVARTAVAGGGSVLHWRRVGDGMPNVQVRDLVLNQTTSILTVGTHGRGMFQMFLPDYAANSGAVRAVSGQSRWTGPVVLTGDTRIGAVGTQQIQNGLSAASIDFGGTISDLTPTSPAPPFYTLTKVGRGTVILSAANTYRGLTDVTEGVVEVKDPNALGAPTPDGNTEVRYGAALHVRSDIELEPITLNGDGIAFSGHYTGALQNVFGTNTYNGPLTLGNQSDSGPPQPNDDEPNQVTIGVASGSSLKIGRNPTGQNPGEIGTVRSEAGTTMGINKELPGTLILASDNLNYVGITQVYTGAVEVRSAEALGPVADTADTFVSDGAAVNIANNTDLLTGPTATVVTAEHLFLSGTGTPDGPGGAGTGALRNTGGNNTWNGPIELTDIPNFAPTTNPGHQVAFGVDSVADQLSVGPTAGITEDWAAFGQFGLIKVGGGALRLTTANQYTGVTNINGGTVRAANNLALGANPPDVPATPYVPSSEVQTIRVFGGGAGAAGEYRLTVNGNPTGILISNPAGLQTPSPADDSSTADQVRLAIEAVIAGNATTERTVFVSRTPNSNGNVYTVTFRGRYSGQNVPQLGFANVASGITVTIATAQEGGLGTVVADGASLELDGNGLVVNEALTINGLGVTDPDGFRYGALGNRGFENTYAGTVRFGSATAVGAYPATSLFVTGRVIGLPTDPTPTPNSITAAAPELTKVGYGTVAFVGDKEYRGRTVVAEGALRINTGGGLGVGRNEVQRLRVTGVLGSEKYTLTLFGETTDAIVLQAGAAGANAVRTALTSVRSGGLPPILTAADVDVIVDPDNATIPAGGGVGEAVFRVTFLGRYANTNVPLLTDISPSTPLSVPAALVVSTVLQGAPPGPGLGVSEIQTFIVPNQGGTFTLAGFATPARDFDVLLTQLQLDFDMRFGDGNTLLTQTVLPGNTGRLISINYRFMLANQNVAQITGTFNPTLLVRTETLVDGAGSETQLVDVRNASGLQYRLSFVNPFTGLPVSGTRILGFNATAEDFRRALIDPTTSGGLDIGDGNVTVIRTTSPGGLQYLVQFADEFANINVLPLTVTIVNGGANITVNTLQDGYEGTVVNAGAALESADLPAISSEWVTINGRGQSAVQSFVYGLPAASGPYTLGYTDPATGTFVSGTRVLTLGNAAGTVAPSTVADFQAAVDELFGAGNSIVTGTFEGGVPNYLVRFTGALTGAFIPSIRPSDFTVFYFVHEWGGGGALRMEATTGNFTTVWGDPNNVSPLILGSNASIGVEEPTNVLRLRLPTTDRNQYASPTTDLGPTDVRGLNQDFSLTKVGLGTLEFNAAGNNDYTGSTVVNDGTLLLNHTGGLPHDAVRGTLVIGDNIQAFGLSPAPALSQTAVVRLANSDQIANAPPVIANAPAVTVNADGLLDLHGWVETIGNLTITRGVVDTEAPTVPAYPVVNPGVSVAGPELITGTITITGGRLTVREGDDLLAGTVAAPAAVVNDGGTIQVGITGAATAVVGTITATNSALVFVANGATLTSSTILLTGSVLAIGNVLGSGATVLTNGASVTAQTGSNIRTGTNSVLDLRTGTGAPRGALTLTDSLLAPQIGASGVDLLTGPVSLTNSALVLGDGPSALLDTGGATIVLTNSQLTTGVGGAVVMSGNVTVTGPASTGGVGATEVIFGTGTVANLGTLTLRDADLDARANVAVSTTGAVTLTDATADFLADSSLTTTAGGVSLTRSRLSGTTGVNVFTQAVTLTDDSRFDLGAGPSAELRTGGQPITVTGSTLTTGNGALVNQVGGAGALVATGALTTALPVPVFRRSAVNFGANSVSTFTGTTLGFADLTTGAGATLTGGNLDADDSTVVTGSTSTTTFGTVDLTRGSLTTGTGSTFNSGAFATTDGDVTLGGGSTAIVSGSLTAADALVTLNAGADLTAGPLSLTRTELQLDASAGTPTEARFTTVALNEALIDLQTNSTLEASGTVTVAGSANGSSAIDSIGAATRGVFRLTGAGEQSVSVADGAATEDFTISSGLTQTAGQTVVKAGLGRLTLAPTGTTLTTLLRVAAGDVQVDTLTGPVQVDAGGTVSGNGTTGAITVPSGATVGTVSPGDGHGPDRTGILTANGDVTFGPTSTLFLNLNGNDALATGALVPGADHDQLLVTGNVTIAAGATLTGILAVPPADLVRLSDRFVVVRATGTITGTFAELPTSPGFVFIDGYKFDISYTIEPGTGNSLVVLDKVQVVTMTALSSTNDFGGTSGSPSTLNQAVTFTATVTAEPGSRVPPPGTTFVHFYENTGVPDPLTGSLLRPLGGPVPIGSDGTATRMFTFTTAGTRTITADYLGDTDNFAVSTSNPLTQIVEQPAVSILGATPSPAPISPTNPSSANFNDALTLTVGVTGERSAYTPTLIVTGSGGEVYRQTLSPTTTPATPPFPGFTVGRAHPGNTTQFTATWNGLRNVAGSGVVPDGDYQVVISTLDERGNTFASAAVTVRVDNTDPLGAGNVGAPVIKPDNATAPPPATTVFTGTIIDDNLGTWTVTVTDSTGATVRTFSGTGPTVSATWDGSADVGYPNVDVNGNVLDGRYTLTLVARDAGGNTNVLTSPVQRTVYVISTAPAVTLLSGRGTVVGPTTYGDAVTLTAVVDLPAFVQAADKNTFLSGKPVSFAFPGTTTVTSNLVFNATLNRYEATSVVALNLAAGTYSPITATFQPTAELPQAVATGSHTVNRAQLRVTAVNTSRPYAEANPDFDYVVTTADLKYADTVAVVSGEPTTLATMSSPVDAYAITRGTVTALPNYDVAFTNGVFGITPVPLTIQVNDATRARFGQNPAFTATFDGFKLSDGPGVVNNLNLVTDAQTNSPIGTYSIFSSTTPTATNYFPITVIPGILTVTGSPNVTVVGSGEGSPPQAQVLSPAGDKLQNIPFDASFNRGVRTAAGDFNKDGVADYVIGSGPGRQAFVQVIDGTNGDTLFQAFPFEAFDGGVFVAAGDMTGDGIAELVITPDEGGGPRVVIYRGGDFSPLVSYFAIDDANFRGGVRPAVGDLDGDGFADLVVSAGFGGGPRISVWDGERLGKLEFVNMINDFFAYEDTLRNGAFVAVGDVTGDGLGDLIVGGGPGGGPRVKVYDGGSLLSVGGNDARVVANYFAGNEANRGGVKVVAKNLDGDKFIDVVTGGGKGDRAVATAYRGSALAAGSPAAVYEFDLDGTLNGVFVG